MAPPSSARRCSTSSAVLDLDLPLDAALAQTRFHHQWQPDALRLETKAADSLRDFLTKLGHHLEDSKTFGASNGVAFSDGTFTAANANRAFPSEGGGVVDYLP